MMRRIVVFVAMITALLTFAQDQPKNTCVVKIYPHHDEITQKADSFVKQGRYKEALDLYEKAMKDYGDCVMKSAGDLYIGVWKFCIDRIKQWPEEGRLEYTRRYDPVVQEKFLLAKQTSDKEKLKSILNSFPLSTFAGDIVLNLANLYLDDGELPEAAKLLEDCPDLLQNNHQAIVTARLGLCYQLLGNRTKLLKLIESTSSKELTVIKDNIKVDLRDYLNDLLKKTKDASGGGLETDPDSSWPVHGGNPASTKIGPHDIKEYSTGWSFSLPRTNYVSTDYPFQEGSHIYMPPHFNPLFPCVQDGVLYIHSESSIYAFDLFDSSAEPIWSKKFTQPSKLLMFDDRTIHTITFNDERVYAPILTNITKPDVRLEFLTVKYPFPKRALYCFDSKTGEVVWKLGGSIENNVERGATFNIAPTPYEERLYAGAIKQEHPQDPFEHYVLCIDKSTGKILWKTFVGSGGTEINLFGNSIRESIGSKVAISADNLFYLTNHGVASRLDRHTGLIKWLYKYSQLPVQPTRQFPPPRYPLGWINNPPIIYGNIVIFTPLDSDYLYALDIETGKLLYSIARSGQFRYVYGVKDGLLILGNESINLYDARTGKLRGSIRPRSPGVGKGFVTENFIYMPTSLGISILDFKTLKEVDFRALGNISGGNLLIIDNCLILTTLDNRLSIYYEKVNEKEFEERLKKAHSVAGYYKLALQALQLHKIDLAMDLFKKAAGSETESLKKSATRHLFRLNIKQAKDHEESGDYTLALHYLQAATKYAESVQQVVDLKFKRAYLLSRTQKHTQAIDELQEVIRQYPAEIYKGSSAFEYAKQSIDKIISQAGQGAYEKYEREAQRLLDDAKSRSSLDELEKIYELYPNSSSAGLALYYLAEILLNTSHFDRAQTTLQLLINKYPRCEKVPQGYVLLVMIMEQNTMYSSAKKLLERMNDSYKDKRIEIDGKQISVSEFVKAKLDQPKYKVMPQTKQLARLNTPITKKTEFADKEVTLLKTNSLSGYIPYYSNQHLKLFDPSLKKVVFELKLASIPVHLTSVSDYLVVFTNREIYSINLQEKRLIWKQALSFEIMDQACKDLYLYLLTQVESKGAVLSCIIAKNLINGETIWQERAQGFSSKINMSDANVVIMTHDPDIIWAFDFESGQVRLKLDLSDVADSELVAVLNHALLIYSTAESNLDAYNYSGKLIWRRQIKGSNPIIKANDKWVVTMTRSQLEFINAQNGKLTRSSGGNFINITAVIQDTDLAYLLGSNDIKAFDTTGHKWTINVSSLTPQICEVTQDHILLLTTQKAEAGDFEQSLILMKKTGLIVQTLDIKFENPCSFTIIDNRIVLAVGDRIEIY